MRKWRRPSSTKPGAFLVDTFVEFTKNPSVGAFSSLPIADSVAPGLGPQIVRWCQTRPGAQVPGVGEPVDIADLSAEHRGVDPADTVEPLDHPITNIILQLVVDAPLELADLLVEDVDQVSQGVDPHGVAVAYVE